MVLTMAPTVVVATMIAATAGLPDRRDGLTYPADPARAAAAFAATLMLAAAITGAVVALIARRAPAACEIAV